MFYAYIVEVHHLFTNISIFAYKYHSYNILYIENIQYEAKCRGVSTRVRFPATGVWPQTSPYILTPLDIYYCFFHSSLISYCNCTNLTLNEGHLWKCDLNLKLLRVVSPSLVGGRCWLVDWTSEWLGGYGVSTSQWKSV